MAGEDFRIEGLRNLERLGVEFRAGAKDLQKDLMRAMNKAAKDKALADAVSASAADTLPSRGGLGDYISAMKIVAKVRTRGKNIGVRLVGSLDSEHSVKIQKIKARVKAKRRRADRAYEKAVKAEEG